MPKATIRIMKNNTVKGDVSVQNLTDNEAKRLDVAGYEVDKGQLDKVSQARHKALTVQMQYINDLPDEKSRNASIHGKEVKAMANTLNPKKKGKAQPKSAFEQMDNSMARLFPKLTNAELEKVIKSAQAQIKSNKG